MIKTVEWTDEGVRMLDQRLLPNEEMYLMLRSAEEVAEAIKDMAVRGAPAIGVSAALGLAVGIKQAVATNAADLRYDFDYMCDLMSRTRPTAVNLFWGIERMRRAFDSAAAETDDAVEIKQRVIEEAVRVYDEDIASNRRLGRFGGELIPDGATVLTHCNAGALATAGDYGTALGVIPFYVAAPVSTVDLKIPDGGHIPIEERDAREITHLREHQLTPTGVETHN